MIEGLKTKYGDGGGHLWAVMVTEFASKFPGPYPNTDELRAIACQGIPAKQQLEEEGNNVDAPIFLKKLERLGLGLPPRALTIISRYAVTWVVV